MLDRPENIKRIKAEINNILLGSQKTIYMLVDGDRTLISSDSTRLLFKYLDLDFNAIKTIFQEHGYSYEAFFKVALFYSNIPKHSYNLACQDCANGVNVYSEFLSFFDALKNKVEFIVVTSGSKQSWKNVLLNNSLGFVHLIGGNYFPADQFVVDQEAKGIIANTLSAANKQVFAFGDSLVDFDMLKEADHAYLIVNEKQNKDIIPFAAEITPFEQISFSDFYHEQIPVTTLNKVADQILTHSYEGQRFY